jgi:hypothetical protein
VNSGISFNQPKKGTAADPSSPVNLALPSSADHCKVPDDDTYYVDLYKNGQLINTTTSYSGLLGTPTSTLKIGRTGNVTAGFFIGYIDEARLYNRALSLNEIQAIYAGGAQ